MSKPKPRTKSNRWGFTCPESKAAISRLCTLGYTIQNPKFPTADVSYITFSESDHGIVGFLKTRKCVYTSALLRMPAFKTATFNRMKANNQILDTLMEIQLSPSHNVYEFGKTESARFNKFVKEISIFKSAIKSNSKGFDLCDFPTLWKRNPELMESFSKSFSKTPQPKKKTPQPKKKKPVVPQEQESVVPQQQDLQAEWVDIGRPVGVANQIVKAWKKGDLYVAKPEDDTSKFHCSGKAKLICDSWSLGKLYKPTE